MHHKNDEWHLPEYQPLLPLTAAFRLGMEKFDEINNTIDGRIAGQQRDAGVLAQVVAAGGDGDHLEIGTFFGGTAVLAALTKERLGLGGNIVCVDNFEFMANVMDVGPDKVLENAGRFNVEDRIVICQGHSDPLPLPDDQGPFATCLIDASHTYNDAIRDWRNAREVTEQLVAFHDADRGHMGVVRAVREAALEWPIVFWGFSTAVVERP